LHGRNWDGSPQRRCARAFVGPSSISGNCWAPVIEPADLLVSVVTVVRNDAAGLERTMDSIRSLDYRSIEYIVVDGASTDGTRQVIERRKAEVRRWISEPDSGIYEAMNKGVRVSSGDYVCFMNAGDLFASRDAVTRMFVPHPRSELVWGDCIVQRDRGEEYDPARDVIGRLHRQMTVCHQSLFTRRAALLARPYDESLRIAADYDFLCDRLLAGASWEYRPFPVSRINDAGVSALAFRTSIREKRRIALRRFPGKRASILLYYSVLSLYMNAKALTRGLGAGRVHRAFG
jgi:glycosyltransferase involved in cell wall biosynthesis